MKKILAILLAAIMLLACTACGQTPPAPTPGNNTASGGDNTGIADPGPVEVSATTKDTLVIANCAGEPANIHPYDSDSQAGTMILQMIMEPVLRPDTEGNLYGVLAESWDVAEDSITFHLRHDVVFSNGSTMNAEDVVFSFQACMSSNSYARRFTSVDVAGITAADEYTVVVPLTKADPDQIVYFYMPLICDKETYEAMGEDNAYKPVGSGPFVMGDWVIGDRIELNRNDNYWNGNAALSKVIVRTISEASQAMIELETKGVDIIVNPDSNDVSTVLTGGVNGIKAVTWASTILRNNNIQFNYNSELGANLLIRQAVAHCVDREAWVNIISPATGAASYSPITQAVFGFVDHSADYPYAYDLEAAKDCLKAAGYADGVTLTVLTDSRAYHQTLLELLLNSCAQAGITLNIQTMELGVQREQMATGEGFDMYILDNVCTLGVPLASIDENSNPSITDIYGYNMEADGAKEYLAVLEEIKTCFDSAKRAELVGDMQKLFNENVIWIPVNTIQSYFLAADNLQNLSCRCDILLITADTFFN